MAGPWEQYAATDGPWSQYASAQPQTLAGHAMDFVKSIPRGILQGAGNFGSMLAGAGDPAVMAAMAMSGQDPLGAVQASKEAAEKAVTGGINKAQEATGVFPEAQGRAGKFGAAIGEGLGNPLSYIGPGGLPLKVGGAVLSSAGSEAARQGTEGTAFEKPASIVGALAGGAAAGKVMAPKQPMAAVPTSAELRAAKDAGYKTARDADLSLDPLGPAFWASRVEDELTNGPKYAFTPGANGTAPKTLAVLAEARALPAVGEGERAVVTGANLDALRIKLNNIAGETHEFKPTPDAKAAMVAKRRLAEYTENIPPEHVLGGDAATYGSATKTANANNAAFQRTRDIEQKLTNAVDATEGSQAAKIDNQIKSKLRSGYLTNEKKQRGLTQDEVAAIRDTNRGSATENALRQFGRLAPEGPMNLALHIGTGLGAAAATGGVSIPIQIAGALAASAAKHGAQHITQRNANRLVEMLAKRSPEYERRLADLPPVDTSNNAAAILRALLTH